MSPVPLWGVREHFKNCQLCIRRHAGEVAAVGGDGTGHMGAMALHIVHVCVPVCIVVGKGHLPADVDLVQISCGMEVQVFHSGLHPGPGHGLTGGLCGKGLMITTKPVSRMPTSIPLPV